MAQSQVGKWHSGLLPGWNTTMHFLKFISEMQQCSTTGVSAPALNNPAATRKLLCSTLTVLEPQLAEGLTTGVRRVWNVSFFSCWICRRLAEQDFFEGVNSISRNLPPTPAPRP